MSTTIQKQKSPYTKTSFSFSFESHKRNNIHFVDDSTIVLAVGNTLQFFNIETCQYKWIEGKDRGIGAIAVHPSRQYIAIGEKGNKPKIRILTYPQLSEACIIEGGTTNAYLAMNFNSNGSKLVTVGGSPDYMMTIWNWKEKKTILRSKAFGQDIYNVSFSKSDEGQLTTSGVGHIKFWKMAGTFTGLKLQGEVGKFGKLDISDVAGYVELPDGKVLSGSECGDLLLWEGNLIKVQIKKNNEAPCHDGMIETIMLEDKYFITAGHDGYIKFWDFETIDTAEGSDTSNLVLIDPIVEFKVGDNVKIQSLIKGKTYWVIQDLMGALWKATIRQSSSKDEKWSFNCEKLIDFHSGPISGIAPAPKHHLAITAGLDGTVRLFDYIKNKFIYMGRYSAGATSVLWSPLSIDEEGKQITVGFKDGTMRILNLCDQEFDLLHVSKPHTKAITSMKYTYDAELLATGSEDCTIFFFDRKYNPIGFTRVHSPVRSLEWTQNDKELLIFLHDGSLLKMQRPNPKEIDTSKTYEFTTQFKKYLYHQFLKPPPPKPEKKKKDDEESRPDEGIELDTKNDKPIKQEEPPAAPLLCGLLSKQGKIYMSFDKEGGVFEYSGNWWEDDVHTTPEYPQKCITPSMPSVTHMQYSNSEKYFILGAIDGTISLQLKNGAIETTRNLHDCTYGRILQAVTSFDNSHLFSVGEDGCFFVQRIEEEQIQTATPIELRIATRQVKDIIGEKSWSIQEAREKAEEEALRSAMENKKMSRKERIDQLRKEYYDLLKENDKKEKDKRLSRKELQLDPTIHERVESRINEKKTIAEKELEYDTRKATIALNKLKGHYLDILDVERIVVYAFRTGQRVTTFRTVKLAPETKTQIEKVHALIAEEINKKKEREKKAQMEEEMVQHHHETPESITPSSKPNESTRKGSVILSSTAQSALEKLEDLRRKREQRKLERQKLLAREPKKDDVDPYYAEEIEKAKKNFGDYKLKTSEDYITAGHRVTAAKKLRQMVLVEESIHTLKMIYNSRVIGLRDLKRRMVERMRNDYVRIAEINEKMGIKETLNPPQIKPEEYPENRSNISDEELEKYRIEKLKEEKRLARIAKAQQMGTSVMDIEDSDDEEETKTKSVASKTSAHSKRGLKRDLTPAERADLDRIARISSITQSELEQAEKEIEYLKLEDEKRTILRRHEKQIESFDAAVNELRREQFKLLSDLTCANLKFLLLYQELQLLKEFETKDNALMQELMNKRQEKNEIIQQIAGCQDKLSAKKEEIEKLCKMDKIINEFVNLVPQNHPAHDALFEVFKTTKTREEKAEAEDAETVDDEEEEGDDDVVLVKPDNCSQQLFEKVLELRKKRLKQDDLLDKISKSVDALKRDRDALLKKESVVNAQLKEVEHKIQQIQRAKQQKLNEIITIVFLKFSQIQCLLQNKLPADLSDYIVFTNKGLKAFNDKIQAHKNEKQKLRNRHKELKQYLKQLQRQGKTHERELQEWKDKVKEIQLLKFGQMVDLELLENAAADEETEELKEMLKEQERIAEEELQKWNEKVEQCKDELTKVTTENTNTLRKLAELRAEKQRLEKDLDLSQATMVKRMTKLLEESGEDKRKQLKELVVLQAQEINACKNEIAILRSKSTHVYTPM